MKRIEESKESHHIRKLPVFLMTLARIALAADRKAELTIGFRSFRRSASRITILASVSVVISTKIVNNDPLFIFVIIIKIILAYFFNLPLILAA